MKVWRQAKWDEPLVFEMGGSERIGAYVSVDREIRVEIGDPSSRMPKKLLRAREPELPELSEVDVIRHFTRLSQMSYGVDNGPMPLGSCTMKYNPKLAERILREAPLAYVHPLQDEETVQGLLEVLYELERWLAEITGMDRCCLQTPAGASGELAGALMIKAYHELRGESHRLEMLVPDSAHGTNPASSAMAGFRVVRIPTDERGNVDLEAVRAVVSDRTAGMMLTNPNTLGLFEERITELADVIHSAGGLLYYDGANLNGIMCIARPGDMGFDIVHLNLHKTFASPHGGGGPGAGPVCARGELVNLLPRPLIEKRRGKYVLNYECGNCVGSFHTFHGNILPLLKSYIYILSMGFEGLREAAIQSVLNTNYFISLIRNVEGFKIPYAPERPRKHEVVISAKPLSVKTGVTAEDVAKALLDYGLYAPTVYFPLVVEEALMIEFTETESPENIELYAKALSEIAERALKSPEELKSRPLNTSVGRLDLIRANHPLTVTPSYRVYKLRKSGAIRKL